MNEQPIVFCKGGGCTAKLGPGALSRVLSKLPKFQDPNLLVGYDHSDDAAVYQLRDDLALVQTLDFFPPMVEDPYIFGQIAAANALSDVWAMGGTVKTALNIVCFPEQMDLNILGRILQGGAEKVREAGGVLAGGHSIADADVKYGLSVTGTVDPRRILTNMACQAGDVLLLSKPLGVGIVCTAARVQQASADALDAAIASMTTLNKYACEAMAQFDVHGCTDVTGFGLLGHLNEMLAGKLGAQVETSGIPYIPQALDYANEFLLTAAAQRNRNHLEGIVQFQDVPFAMQELLFDPQTSGGLLFSLPAHQAEQALEQLQTLGLACGVVGKITAEHPGIIQVL